MKHQIYIWACLCLGIVGCKQAEKPSTEVMQTTTAIEVQGHRGERGHSPENSIRGYINAIKKGVNVIELDVVIAKDGSVVVSHEPYMAALYVLKPNGDTISSQEEKSLNMYQMTYDSIQKFETGLKGNTNFPQQQKIHAYKPLLSAVIDSVELFVKQHNLTPVGYNIEIKSVPSLYGTYQPYPQEMVAKVMQVLSSKPIAGKWNIQSFDPAILEEVHKRYPKVTLAFLVHREGVAHNLKQLSFVPDIYSPNYKLLQNEKTMDSLHVKQLKVIPWTVNDSVAIAKMIALKVDGIITDYPERVLRQLP
ncbi:glycerophosphoryl diester phosphodiesterase [Pustulibacterium marinum]|uniref:Glycerophosphoryl diester phosphodiesterase n=1 Tax=Pustulibacterium marinum TaxID=1224947 RepID=A0A1I7GEP6_9FLAO|nr:glycerophosphodiester phosphodiesterase family protein [Pustulibacterium marinum]SFU46924.1 glycerophosphoryl diester phosphodiesterase [Pustulibacterium marinum]